MVFICHKNKCTLNAHDLFQYTAAAPSSAKSVFIQLFFVQVPLTLQGGSSSASVKLCLHDTVDNLQVG